MKVVTPKNFKLLNENIGSISASFLIPTLATLLKNRIEKLEPLIEERRACLIASQKRQIISKDGSVILTFQVMQEVLKFLTNNDIKKLLTIKPKEIENILVNTIASSSQFFVSANTKPDSTTTLAMNSFVASN